MYQAGQHVFPVVSFDEVPMLYLVMVDDTPWVFGTSEESGRFASWVSENVPDVSVQTVEINPDQLDSVEEAIRFFEGLKEGR